MDEKIRSFLDDNRLLPDNYPLEGEIAAFRREMTAGLAGEKSSLPMIPCFLAPDVQARETETVIVLDAGGTNLRVGSAAFENGRLQSLDFEKFPLPGISGTLTCEAFFDAVAEKLAPYLHAGHRVGFCFSYVAECLENRDARLKAFCKEVSVTGAEGVEICRALQEAIGRRGETRKYAFVQLNDTVAGMLGGMAAVDPAEYDGFIGFVLGTGTNACYGEKTANITKYTGSAYTASEMVVNMESGCYTGFTGGPLDKILDAASSIPGDHQAEKLISGVYLGKLLHLALKTAAEQGLVSLPPLPESGEIPLAQVNAFLAGEPSALDAFRGPAADFLRQVALALYARAARMMAVVLAAVALQTGRGTEKPMGVVLEGSTYQRSPALQQLLEEELAEVRRRYGVSFRILQAENATLAGAALAALTNT